MTSLHSGFGTTRLAPTSGISSALIASAHPGEIRNRSPAQREGACDNSLRRWLVWCAFLAFSPFGPDRWETSIAERRAARKHAALRQSRSIARQTGDGRYDNPPNWGKAAAAPRPERTPRSLPAQLERQPELADFCLPTKRAKRRWCGRANKASTPDAEVALRRERLALARRWRSAIWRAAFPLARVVAELTAFADRAASTAGSALRLQSARARTAWMVSLRSRSASRARASLTTPLISTPIFLYDRGAPAAPRPATIRVRAAQRSCTACGCAAFGESTDDGYGPAGSTLRLRPASEKSALLSVPVGSALAHYQGQALAWERAAFTPRPRGRRGHCCRRGFSCRDQAFVWRSQLDFGCHRGDP